MFRVTSPTSLVIALPLRPSCLTHLILFSRPHLLKHLLTMQPWQQQSYGYNSFNGGQNPQQTGNGSFMQSQPTGFPGQGQPQSQPGQQQRPGGNLSFLNAPPPSSQFNPGCMAPQMTGYPGAGGGGGMMPQQTGYGGMMSQPTGMMGQQTGMSGMMGQRTGMMPQQTGMMPQQTGYGGGGLMSQPTGFGGGLRAQPTGYQDPRLQSMMQSFMPSNVNQVSVGLVWILHYHLDRYGLSLDPSSRSTAQCLDRPRHLFFTYHTPTRKLMVAVRILWHASIQFDTAEPTPHPHFPNPSPKPFGQNSQSPLDAFQTGEEGL